MMPPKSAETPPAAPADRGDDTPAPALVLPLVALPPDPPIAALTRIRPDHNEWRFYHIEIWPDLFGGVLLARTWGRIGTGGQMRLDFHPDYPAALDAFSALVIRRRKRGYQDQAL
jgi:predicted DNA-binding WGR domain protein